MEKLLPVLIGAAVGALVTAIGWIVTEVFYHRRIRKEATLRRLERQIEDLYGPLLGLIQYSQSIYKVAATILPSLDDKGERTDTSRFNDDDWKVWHFLAEEYFQPINAEVRKLVSSNMHLLEAGKQIKCLSQFFEHVAHSESRYKLWKDTGVDRSHIGGPEYPRDFEKEVEQKLSRLQMRYQHNLRTLGIVEGGTES